MPPSSSFVTGACYIHAGVGTNRAPLFCGVCESSPEIRVKHEWIPLMNALGGSVIESDSSYQGASAHLRMDLTRWTEAVRLAMATVPNVAGTPGVSVFGDLGALALTENLYWPVYFSFPYASKPAYAAAGMQPGVRFLACMCENDDFGNLDTKPRKVSMAVRARRVFNIANLSWTLFDFNVANLPAPS